MIKTNYSQNKLWYQSTGNHSTGHHTYHNVCVNGFFKISSEELQICNLVVAAVLAADLQCWHPVTEWHSPSSSTHTQQHPGNTRTLSGSSRGASAPCPIAPLAQQTMRSNAHQICATATGPSTLDAPGYAMHPTPDTDYRTAWIGLRPLKREHVFHVFHSRVNNNLCFFTYSSVPVCWKRDFCNIRG